MKYFILKIIEKLEYGQMGCTQCHVQSTGIRNGSIYLHDSLIGLIKSGLGGVAEYYNATRGMVSSGILEYVRRIEFEKLDLALRWTHKDTSFILKQSWARIEGQTYIKG